VYRLNAVVDSHYQYEFRVKNSKCLNFQNFGIFKIYPKKYFQKKWRILPQNGKNSTLSSHYQLIGSPSLKNLPVGALSGKVAAQTIPFAPSLTGLAAHCSAPG
jgi:hypothetical protein